MQQLKNLDCNKTIKQFGVELNQVSGGNECEILTHSQQQSQAPNAHKKESTVRLTTRITMLWVPQRSLLYRLKDSIEVKCKTHTQQSTSSTQKRLRLVNLTENAQSDTFKAPCCCFENAPNTALTIVCTINVSIDCNGFDVPNLPQKKNILK